MSRQLLSRSDLQGLFQGDLLSPHAFQISDQNDLLAYLDQEEELIIINLEDMLYSYAYNEEHQLLVLTDRSYDSGRMLKLYDEALSLVKSINVPGNFSGVFWLGDQWGALFFDTLYSLDF